MRNLTERYKQQLATAGLAVFIGTGLGGCGGAPQEDSKPISRPIFVTIFDPVLSQHPVHCRVEGFIFTKDTGTNFVDDTDPNKPHDSYGGVFVEPNSDFGVYISYWTCTCSTTESCGEITTLGQLFIGEPNNGVFLDLTPSLFSGPALKFRMAANGEITLKN